MRVDEASRTNKILATNTHIEDLTRNGHSFPFSSLPFFFSSTTVFAHPASLRRSRARCTVHSTYPLWYVGLDGAFDGPLLLRLRDVRSRAPRTL